MRQCLMARSWSGAGVRDNFFDTDIVLAGRTVVSGVIREERGVSRPLGGAHGPLSILPEGEHPSLHVVINKSTLALPEGETPATFVRRRLELSDNAHINISRQVGISGPAAWRTPGSTGWTDVTGHMWCGSQVVASTYGANITGHLIEHAGGPAVATQEFADPASPIVAAYSQTARAVLETARHRPAVGEGGAHIDGAAFADRCNRLIEASNAFLTTVGPNEEATSPDPLAMITASCRGAKDRAFKQPPPP
jgi:hypothetical protein